MDYPEIPPITEALAAEFISQSLLGEGFRRMFPVVPLATKQSLILLFLIGPEIERYAAEPVYGPTGKGYLKSKGVEGLLAEQALEKSLESEQGQQWVRQFVAAIEKQLF
ncbi:hypothetical protein QT970_03525 [Microcoleus sp. herbarium8]|uniref:hypothetical protein n=1 Tax=Microcoleus sp. herbarium8 TaxID=3055436 RepID=UPI002FD781CB